MKIENKSESNLYIRGLTAEDVVLTKGQTVFVENRLLVRGYQSVLNIFKGLIEWDIDGVESSKPEIKQVEPTKAEENQVVEPEAVQPEKDEAPKKTRKSK